MVISVWQFFNGNQFRIPTEVTVPKKRKNETKITILHATMTLTSTPKISYDLLFGCSAVFHFRKDFEFKLNDRRLIINAFGL